MLDFATTNFGTYHDSTIPQPDEPLTTGWGSAMAWNLAKMTIAKTMVATVNANPATHYTVNATIANFSRIPIIKGYNYSLADGWSDRLWQGTGNTVSGGPVLFEYALLHTITPTTGTAEVSIFQFTIPAGNPIVVLQYGQ